MLNSFSLISIGQSIFGLAYNILESVLENSFWLFLGIKGFNFFPFPPAHDSFILQLVARFIR